MSSENNILLYEWPEQIHI